MNARDSNRYTPLHFAAQQYQVDVAESLLRLGAAVDAQDINGKTAVSNAVFCCQGRVDLIRLLITHGADKDMRNNYGVSPRILSKSTGYRDIVQLFHEP